MKCEDLALDEIQVECEVRDIKGSSKSQLKLLKERLAKETNGELECPSKTHSRAAKSPKYELNLCVTKLKELKNLLTEILTYDDENERDTELEGVVARVQHINDRLKRLGNSSRTYGPKTIVLVELCGNFLLFIEQVRSKETALSDSIDALPMLDRSKELDNVTYQSDADEEDGPIGKLSSPTTQKLQSTPKIDSQTQIKQRENASLLIPGIPGAGSSSDTADRASVSNLGFFHIGQGNNQPNILANQNNKLAEISAMVNELRTNVLNPQLSTPPSSNQNNPASNVSNQRIGVLKPLQIHQWGISYGDSKDRVSIERFLKRVEFLARENHMSLERLSVEIVTILHGVVKEFYWVIQESSYPIRLNWYQIRDALIHRFKSNDTDYDIKNAMTHRKQNFAKNESFSDFYSAVLGMSLSLQVPVPESDLVNLLFENMRPGLQIQLAGQRFQTISDLEGKCRALERTWLKLGYIPEQGSNTAKSPCIYYKQNVSELCGAGTLTQSSLSDTASQQINRFTIILEGSIKMKHQNWCHLHCLK